MRTRVSIYGLAIQNGTEPDPRILLTQLAPQCYRAGSWTLPGGGMDFGESPLQTLVREVHEESALQATEPELFHVHSVSEQTKRGPFQASVRSYMPAVMANSQFWPCQWKECSQKGYACLIFCSSWRHPAEGTS